MIIKLSNPIKSLFISLLLVACNAQISAYANDTEQENNDIFTFISNNWKPIAALGFIATTLFINESDGYEPVHVPSTKERVVHFVQENPKLSIAAAATVAVTSGIGLYAIIRSCITLITAKREAPEIQKSDKANTL